MSVPPDAASAPSPAGSTPSADHLLQAALAALRGGERLEARRLAGQAAALAPEREEPWLILAACTSPRLSLVYLRKALALNPNSARARQGLQWAIERIQAEEASRPVAAARQSELALAAPQARISPVASTVKPAPARALIHPRPSNLPWLLVLVFLGACLLIGLVAPWYSRALAAYDPYLAQQIQQVFKGVPPVTQESPLAGRPLSPASEMPVTLTMPLVTATELTAPSFSPSFTALPTETLPPAATFPPPTLTPFQPLPPTSTDTPFPTELPWTPLPPTATLTPLPISQRPAGVAADEPWVEVNLTLQEAYAWVGDTFTRAFIVSTGTARHPTVTGVYHIYVKYRYAPMSGPGYYLRDVPYVMYFYKGYGLHGTYWHNNFGHPMSHGCVNFRTEDAAWLFDFTEIGTVVYIHY